MKKVGDPVDVANAAVWLISNEASYITGTTLYIDGELPSITNSQVAVSKVMVDWLMLTVTFELVTVFFVIFNRLSKFLVHLKQYGRLVLCLNLDKG